MDEEDVRYCDCCGTAIPEGENYSWIGDEIVCDDCRRNECGCCECCDELIYNSEAITDDGHFVCRSCYENEYLHCSCCGMLLHQDDSYSYNDMDFCYDCYSRKNHTIREYSYKPCPIFYGRGERFLGVELEIDKGGRDSDNAQEILDIANDSKEQRLYIKTDSSLDDGMELVTHPMTLAYHLHQFKWEEILKTAVNMGYKSHYTVSCGLHTHVNRDAFGDDEDEQEEVISRILYFVEHHWLEMVKFSRRTESALNRWAARHGYDPNPKELMDKAKSCYSRYYAVNLCNHSTIEFRLFRGTLKLNTLFATLQLVDKICEIAMRLDDEELQALSWSEFVSHIDTPELIQYLKERRLYINEEINNEEEI